MEPKQIKVNSYFELRFSSSQTSIDEVVKKLREDIKNSTSLELNDTRIYIFKYGPNHIESEVRGKNKENIFFLSDKVKGFIESKYTATTFKQDQLMEYKNTDKIFLLVGFFLTSIIFILIAKQSL
ncbi:hypothetical protein HYS91_01665 [Candidatus Daviesbacteria bacterium]|nr:hypothetical protein [Candidatus Daviesbacteria bacterium]